MGHGGVGGREERAFGAKMAANVRRALLQIAPKARWTDRVLQGRVDPEVLHPHVQHRWSNDRGSRHRGARGIGDSGALPEDLTDLFVAIGEAAQDQGVGVVFLIDEIQFMRPPELEALIVALHRCARRSLPITLVGAGLPQIPRLAGEAKSYSERLFRFPRIGAARCRDARARRPRPAGACSGRRVSSRRQSTSSSTTRKAIRTSCRIRPDRLGRDLGLPGDTRRRRVGAPAGRGRARRELLPRARGTHDRAGAQVPLRDGGLGPKRSARARSRDASSGLWSRPADPLAVDRQGASLHAGPRLRGIHRPAVRPLHAEVPRGTGCAALMEASIAANPRQWNGDVGR